MAFYLLHNYMDFINIIVYSISFKVEFFYFKINFSVIIIEFYLCAKQKGSNPLLIM